MISRYKYLRYYSELSYNPYYPQNDYSLINTFYPMNPKDINISSTDYSQKIKNLYDTKALYKVLGVHLEDNFLENHSNKVSFYCSKLGKALELEENIIRELELAGMLHDIGKAFIPKEIINKPGLLNEQEWKIVRNHSRIGYDILRSIKEYSNIAKYTLYHHERIDGTGYPAGLKGEEIPYPSRIIAVVDAYEAMTQDRPYRKAMSEKEAIAELIRFSGTQFDKNVVNVFIDKVLKQ
ncbi:MAG: HD-GYP domain-containing protein [Bacillota bacterium]